MILLKKTADLIYPPRCPICHDIRQPGRMLICDECVKKLPFVTGPTCRKCGKPIDPEDGERCFDCSGQEHVFDRGMGVFLYNDVMRKSIHYFKYKGRMEYGTFYAHCAWKAARENLELWKPQVIVPVPVHKMRLRRRGYNQAEIIGKELSRLTGIPCETGYVRRVTRTRAQKDLSPEERRKNLEHAFAPGRLSAEGKRVLLVDDIYTTGSTMDAVSRILKQGGAKEIYALSICIGRGFMVQ